MKDIQDLVIIGGGIMGLFSAYYASGQNKKITILEKSFIGNKDASSFSLTRSIRSDYPDPFYAKLAYQAQKLWRELEDKTGEELMVKCGCLNLSNKDITPNFLDTYAGKVYKTLLTLNLNVKLFDKNSLVKAYPQFKADYGSLDVEAGFLYLPRITKNLLEILGKRNVIIWENSQITKIKKTNDYIEICLGERIIKTKKVIITAGRWANDVLSLIENCDLNYSITPQRPNQCLYYIPSSKKQKLFTSNNLPVFAYLDIGIYGHPIYLGKTPGVKIGFYNPPGIEANKKIRNIADFVELCMPDLKRARVQEVKNVDLCYYDMTLDNDFILGALPGFNNIFIGTGWNGTGYKFSPLIGKILSELVISGSSIYDIGRFSPARFTEKAKIVNMGEIL